MTFLVDPELYAMARKAAEPPESKKGPVPAMADDDEDLGELQIAEYLVFLLSLETYLRWLEEVQEHDTSGESDNPHDDADDVKLDELATKGLRLLVRIDSQMAEAVTKFVTEQLPSEPQKKMFNRGMGRSIRTVSGVIYRAYQVQQCLERGGAATLRAVFDNNRAIRLVKNVMALSDNEPATVAIPEFASYPMSNALIRRWLDDAADEIKKQSPVGTKPLKVQPRAIDNALSETSGAVEKLRTTQAVQLGTNQGSEVLEATRVRHEQLAEIETKATEAAKRAMDAAGEEDKPLTKSEVIGVATAAALAASTDPQDPTNVPATLRAALGRDDEQMSAALTDGRVVVSAGAGSGKTKTVVARVEYLIKDRGVSPSRIIVTSFNREAADELKHRISQSIGAGATAQIDNNVDTMHSLFRRMIIKPFGSPADQARVSTDPMRVQSAVSRTVNEIWRKEHQEYDPETGEMKDGRAPRLRSVGAYRSKWKGNGVSPEQAVREAASDEELEAAKWYEMYEGLKGNIPGWKPAFRSPEGRTTYERFLDKSRAGGTQRLADFDDWLEMARDILRDNPQALRALQGSIDHILVDECQDLNAVQGEVFDLLSGHMRKGDGRSYWQTGDQKQCIYSFRGAQPEAFREKQASPEWTSRQITTNYRCPPGIVTAANRMISNNPEDADFTAKPAPNRQATEGSIVQATTTDEAQASRLVISQIVDRAKARTEVGKDPGYEEHAVLARTNRELDYYETALILRGIPYARKGAKATFGTPEMRGALGAMSLVSEQDSDKSAEALVACIAQPFKFLKLDKTGLKKVISNWARRSGVAANTVIARDAMDEPRFREMLAAEISQESRGWKFNNTLARVEMMAEDLQTLRTAMGDDTPMNDVMDVILSFRGIELEADPDKPGKLREVTKSFRDIIRKSQEDKSSDEDADLDDEEVNAKSDLGGLSFMYDLMAPNPDDPHDAVYDPTKVDGFVRKIGRIQERAKDLSIDLSAWKKQQQTLPVDKRTPPPAVYLGTIHSTKGAQWDSTYLLMPEGTFPMKFRVPPGTPPDMREEMEASPAAVKHYGEERRLAYVAVTRSKQNLTVVSPLETGGKPGGISRFVTEMGLKTGENIGVAEEALADQDASGALESGVSPTPDGTAVKVAHWDEEEGY
jgi:superfamily I DNA/RNA helicase